MERRSWLEAPHYAFLSQILWLRLSAAGPLDICRRIRALTELEDTTRRSERPGYPPTPSPFLTWLTCDVSKEYWRGFGQMLMAIGEELTGQARVGVLAVASLMLDI